MKIYKILIVSIISFVFGVGTADVNRGSEARSSLLSEISNSKHQNRLSESYHE